MRHDVSRELRNPHGEWTKGGGAATEAERTFRSAVSGRAKVQTPSKFRHPFTGAPMGKSEIGDTFEHLFAAKGAKMVEAHFGHPYIAISGAEGAGVGGGRSARTSPLDFKLDSKYGGELKTLNSKAASQKTAIKKEEQLRKESSAAAMKLKPMIIVQVVDMDTQTVNVYHYPRFGSKAVSKMTHVGAYKFSPEDFKNAQIKSGHWAKRLARAGQPS